MKFIKNHKVEFALLMVVVTLILVFGIVFCVMWFSGSNNEYGNRLEGIDKVKLSDGYIKDIDEELKKEEFVKSVKHTLEGRLVSFIVTVEDDTDVTKAEALGEKIIANFEEKELAYYDIQLYLKDSKNDEESKYPVIGYKHKTEENFVW